MNLPWTVEDVVPTGRAPIVPFEWFFLLTGLRATESGINCRVFGVVTVIAALVSVATWSAITIFGI